jgi:hypothetical protein
MRRKFAGCLDTEYAVATDEVKKRGKPGRKVPEFYTCQCIAPVLDNIGECSECSRVPLSYLLDRIRRHKESLHE